MSRFISDSQSIITKAQGLLLDFFHFIASASRENRSFLLKGL